MSWFHRKRKPDPPPPQPEAPYIPPQPCLSYRGANLQGIGSRSEQQDAFAFVNLLDVTCIREQGLLAIVADGMGGMEGGAFASQTAVSCLMQGFQGMDRTESFYYQLCDSLQSADNAVYQKLRGTGGSTAVVCILFQEQLWYASVGDSFLFLRRGGELYRLNSEQNVLHERWQAAIRRGQLCADAAEKDRESQAVSCFLGMGGLGEIDGFIRPLDLQDGDILLLCSDGVAGVLSEEDLQFALSRSTPQEMCADLDRMIQSRQEPYQDNYTALMIQCMY